AFLQSSVPHSPAPSPPAPPSRWTDPALSHGPVRPIAPAIFLLFQSPSSLPRLSFSSVTGAHSRLRLLLNIISQHGCLRTLWIFFDFACRHDGSAHRHDTKNNTLPVRNRMEKNRSKDKRPRGISDIQRHCLGRSQQMDRLIIAEI